MKDGWDGRIGATEYAGGNGTRKRGGDAERITRGERLGLSLCAVPSPRRMWGSFDLQMEQGLWNNEGIVSGVVTPVRKRIRTEDLGLIEVRIQEA